MDGPVIKAAKKALETGDVNLVLMWGQPSAEEEITRAFAHTLEVPKLSADAKKLADMYFFETLVRIHRAGEGEPYTGLKPAGLDMGPAIAAADKAVESGSAKEVLTILNEAVHHGLHERFMQIMAKKKFHSSDVSAGREFVQAYVNFVHFVERIYESTQKAAHGQDESETEAELHQHNH